MADPHPLELPVTRHVLANGLVVLVHEEHRCPIVAVNVCYRVGSKDEPPDRTGFAHLFEHLMFEGSEHHNHSYFEPLQQAGAAVNGSTNADRTIYWEVVPTSALDLALWMESDRMGHLLPALTEARFSTQRDVVLNERRQNYENRPYGLAAIALLGALFPPGHPYRWATIGNPADLRAASLDDARAFFARYYHPGNAMLALAGDISTDDALRRAEAYFGVIPGSRPAAPAMPEPPASGDVRIVFEDRVELPRLYLGWHSPAFFAAGDAELDLLADVLAGGKSSRLYRALVFDRRLATDVAAAQNSRLLGSFFSVAATAAPGHTLDEIDRAIREEVSKLLATGPEPAELERSLVRVEAHFIYRLQNVGGFGGRADQINLYEMYIGDPSYFGRDRQRYLLATPGGIRAAGLRALDEGGRVAVSVVPNGRLELALSGSETVRPS